MATLFICALAGWRLPLFHWRWVIVSSWPFLGSSHFSRRVYVRSLCCEYRASFIMKLELMIITKILYHDPPWKRDEGERGNGLFIVQEISITYILTLQCIICDFWNLESDTRNVILARSLGLKIRDFTRIVGASLKPFPPHDLADTISLMVLLERRKWRSSISLRWNLLLLLGFESENR